MKKTPAVFLDRDGVINIEKNYLFKVSEFEFIGDVFDNCRRFNSLGYRIVIVTNQAGIARGYYDEKAYSTLTSWMLAEFAEHKITISGVYHCPHHPEGVIEKYAIECLCRKPNPGMFIQAQQDLNIDMKRSLMLGDKLSDVKAGLSAGVGRNVLVRTGHSLSTLSEFELEEFEVIDCLSDLEIENIAVH